MLTSMIILKKNPNGNTVDSIKFGYGGIIKGKLCLKKKDFCDEEEEPKALGDKIYCQKNYQKCKTSELPMTSHKLGRVT